MASAQLKAFLAQVKGDSNLQEKINAIKSPDVVARIAKEDGHEVTADKVIELSEEERDGLAGDLCGAIVCGDYSQATEAS